MSASLVGSEMCIRDRPPPRAVEQPRVASRTWASHHLRTRRSWPCEGGAVSYTHLTLPTICSV
eukprot:9069712-Alexandrium_andersonii.AAC.1